MNAHLRRLAHRRLGLSIAAAIACASLSSASLAQRDANDMPPLYRVEVIVFAYANGDSNEEHFAHNASRAAVGGVRGNQEVATFDFAPFVGAEEPENAAGAEESRLLRTDGIAPGGLAPSGPPRAGDPPEGQAAAPDDAGSLVEPTEIEPADPLGDDAGIATASFRFRLLRPDELNLVDARRRLERLDAYTPLVHGGWIQEGLPQNDAKAFDIVYLGSTNPAGTVRLHVSRFLHLSLNLDYRLGLGAAYTASRPAEPPIGGDAERSFPGGEAEGSLRPFATSAPLSEVEVAPRYRLRAERRISSGTVQYFDHPMFGVVVLVEPYQPPEATAPGGVGPAA